VFALLLFSCEKGIIEDSVPINVFGIEFKNGILQFVSIESYTAIVESQSNDYKSDFIGFLDGTGQYVSLRKANPMGGNTSAGRALSSQEQEIIETNEFLSSILNKDGLIIIGTYAFKVNLSTEKVYAMEAGLETEIDDLKAENVKNSNIMVFSTGDDVLDLLAEGSRGTANGRGHLFCRENGATGNEDKGYDTSPHSGDFRQDNKVVYQKAGVYFSLQAKTKVQFRGWTGIWGGGGLISDQRIEYYVKFKPRCRDVVEHFGTRHDDGPSDEFNYRPYESIRGLHRYRYEAIFFGADFWSRRYVIADGY